MGLVLQLQLILLLVLVINNDWQGYGKPSGFGSKGSKGRGLGRHLAILEKPYSLQGFQGFEYIIFSCIYDEFNDNFLYNSMRIHGIQPFITKLMVNQVIFITLATFKRKKWSKPLRVRGKGIRDRGQGSHFGTLDKILILGQG